MNPSTPGLAELRIDRGNNGEEPRRRGWIVVLVLLAALGALGAYRWRQYRIPEVRLHTLVAPASASGRAVLNASGYVVARREATVSSKVTGKVVEVLFEEGVRVETDQVLARLDDANLKAALRLAEAQFAAAQAALAETRARLEEAEKNQRRVRELSTSQVASEAELDRVEAEVLSLRARLALQQADITVAERGVARWQQELDDTIIRAPFAGVATAKNAQPGEMISPMSAGGGFTRTGIGTIVDMNSLEIEVDVNESFIKRVHAGQAVVATLDAYPDWKIPTKVIAIIPTADRQKATVRVRVGFEQLDPRMLPQMGVKVAFQADPAEAESVQVVTVPTAALFAEDGHDYVWRFRNGQIERVKVRIGSRRPDEATVNEGLSPGDQVVVNPAPELREGSPVRAQRR
jgi:RND family efflux transporter MFP subunit